MVAVPASQPDLDPRCASCSQPLHGEFAPHLCGNCGYPQPWHLPGETYFSALGAQRAFKQDPARLQETFYRLSRALHPDRFTGSGSQAQKNSLDRMSFLNQAYNTLRDRDALRFYLLELEGLKPDADESGKKGAQGLLPMELAENWFDIQDSLAEDPQHAGPKLIAFEAELKDAIENEEKRIAELESQYDESGARAPLESLFQRVKSKNYLKSLQRDVERIRARLQAG